MKISVNWLSDYLDVAPLKKDLKSVLHQLTMRGLEVEAVTDLAAGFQNVVVAQVLKKDRHPNADKLSLCQVTDGKETYQIVCGAQNFKAQDKVALSKIGAHLPNDLKIVASKIRDVESFGMLCSEVELGLATESAGIMILDPHASLGMPVADYLGRNDIVFDVNVTPNRGDALSFVGVARELAAVLGQKIKMPSVVLKEAALPVSNKLKIFIEEGQGCSQYHGRYLENIKVGPAPRELAQRLESVGVRSINNVVDITNFVMLELGTPLHAFDADLLEGEGVQKVIRVRRAKNGEELPLLDGTQAKLHTDDLVIADAKKPIALAGVMGGGNSEVSEKTKNILLEAAEFLPVFIRKSSKRHQKHTEASHRFERQIDPQAVAFAMDRAAALIEKYAGATVYKGMASTVSAFRQKVTPVTVLIDVEETSQFLGIPLTLTQIQTELSRIGFSCEKGSRATDLKVTVPSYRTDVSLIEDIYEEVLRCVGYDKVPAKLLQGKEPILAPPSVVTEQRTRWIEKIKIALAQAGCSECVNFAFTSHEKVQTWSDVVMSRGEVVTLQNPLSEEFSTLKTSLLPGLFENLLLAYNHQQKNVRLFEVRPVYFRDETQTTGVREEWRVAVLVTGQATVNALSSQDRFVDFFDMKGVLETLMESVGAKGLRYQDFEKGKISSKFHPYQSVALAIGRGVCGVLGRLHPQFELRHKLRQPVLAFEFSLDALLETLKPVRKYVALSKFPKITRDFSLLVPAAVRAEKVAATIMKLGKPLTERVVIVDRYAGDKIPAGCVSLSVSLTISDAARTLEDTEVDALSQNILAGLDKELSVKLRLQ